MHTTDGRLRRLVDEPFAVADAVTAHVDECPRCTARGEHVAADAATAHRILSTPRLVPDVDRGWARLQAALDTTEASGARAAASTGRRTWPVGVGRRFPALAGRSLRVAVAVGAVVVVLAGGAAAATVTGVFAPTHVAPVPVSSGDLQAMATLMDFAGNGFGAGFPTPSGSGNLPFGTLRWSTTGTPQQYSSPGRAEAATGLRLALPAHLPAGVGQVEQYVAQAQVSATVTFNSTAGELAGHSATIEVGPAIVAMYGSAGASSPRAGSAQAGSPRSDVPVLVVGTMARPTATTSGVTLAQVESFLLSRPGVPPALAEEIRLLGNISDVLPVPTPAGLNSSSVKIGQWPGVAVSDPSGAVSGVIYEDGDAVIHAAGGLLNRQEILNVAQQLG